MRGDLTGRQECRGNKIILQTYIFNQYITKNDVTLLFRQDVDVVGGKQTCHRLKREEV